MSGELIAELDRPETLVTIVDNIFIGTILSSGATISRYGHGDNWTPYSVKAEQQLLGHTAEEVTLTQMGGLDPETNTIEIIEGDPLLEVGSTNLIAARNTDRANPPEPEEKYIVVPIYGHIPIESEERREQLIQQYTDLIEQAHLGS